MGVSLSVLPVNSGYANLTTVEAYPTGGTGPTAYGPTSYFGSDPLPAQPGLSINKPIDLGEICALLYTIDISNTHGGKTRQQSSFYTFSLTRNTSIQIIQNYSATSYQSNTNKNTILSVYKIEDGSHKRELYIDESGLVRDQFSNTESDSDDWTQDVQEDYSDSVLRPGSYILLITNDFRFLETTYSFSICFFLNDWSYVSKGIDVGLNFGAVDEDYDGEIDLGNIKTSSTDISKIKFYMCSCACDLAPGTPEPVPCVPIDSLPFTTIAGLTTSGFEFTIGHQTYSNFVVTGATAGNVTISIDPTTFEYTFVWSNVNFTSTSLTYQYTVTLSPAAIAAGVTYFGYNTGYAGSPVSNLSYKFRKILTAYMADGTTQITGGTLSGGIPANAKVTAENAVVTIPGIGVVNGIVTDGPYTFAGGETGPIVFKNTITRPTTGGRINVITDSTVHRYNSDASGVLPPPFCDPSPVPCVPIDSSPFTTIAGLTTSGFEFTIGHQTYSNFVVTGATEGNVTISIDPTAGESIFTWSNVNFTGTSLTYQYTVTLSPAAIAVGMTYYKYNTSFTDSSTNNTGKYKKVLKAYMADGTTQIIGGTLGGSTANAAVTADTALVTVGPNTFKAVTSDGPYTFAAGEIGPVVFKATITRLVAGGRIDLFSDSVSHTIDNTGVLPPYC